MNSQAQRLVKYSFNKPVIRFFVCHDVKSFSRALRRMGLIN